MHKDNRYMYAPYIPIIRKTVVYRSEGGEEMGTPWRTAKSVGRRTSAKGTISRELAIVAHRHQWGKLVEDATLGKNEACLQTMAELKIPTEKFSLMYDSNHSTSYPAPQSFCFLCEYVYGARVFTEAQCLKKCPLGWPDGKCINTSPATIGGQRQTGLYYEWRWAHTLPDGMRERAKLAEKIRDLPESPI